jgi:glc operon protein GlcG
VLVSGYVRADAALPSRPVLTLEAATRIADAAQLEAIRRKATVVIAVVDAGGTPIVLRRLDDTQVASVQVAIDKGRTAAIFRRPSKEFEDQVRNGRVSALALAGSVALQGGLPLNSGGAVVGAIGVSGNTPQEDEDIARAGVAALAQAAPLVSHWQSPQVRAAFAKGEPILETARYKVHASRRTEPGMAEVHAFETDVIYVLEGRATLVTGGLVVEPRVTAPGEIRGAFIDGGDARELGPGDVVVVPPGTPHWFKAASNPFLYYVVKPITF